MKFSFNQLKKKIKIEKLILNNTKNYEKKNKVN